MIWVKLRSLLWVLLGVNLLMRVSEVGMLVLMVILMMNVLMKSILVFIVKVMKRMLMV